MTPSRIPISDFTYIPVVGAFMYRVTGEVWKARGVDAVVGRVEGMRASEWLKLFGGRR